MDGLDVREALAKNIKRLRFVKEMTQEELAFTAGISIPFLSDIERANKWPHPETLAKIATAFNIELYELFLMDDFLSLKTQNIYNKKIFDELISAQKTATDKVMSKYFNNI